MNRDNNNTLIFQPMGRRVPMDSSRTVAELARAAGVELESACGGKGTCGKCRVRLEAPADAPTDRERKHLGGEVDQGWRLACQAHVTGGGTVWVPEESRKHQQVILTTGRQVALELEPLVVVHDLKVPAPELHAVVADRERLAGALAVLEGGPAAADMEADLPLIRGLRSALAGDKGRVGAVLWSGRRLLEVSPGWGRRALGLAVDLGTTTVVAYLLDLASGEPLAVKAEMNPQVAWGDDVVTRISYAGEKPGNLAELSRAVVDCIQKLARAACGQAGREVGDIFDCVLVGNTAMHHIFLQLDPGGLSLAPYTPVASSPLDMPAAVVGLAFAPQARLHVLAVKAGFVGADTVAVALAVDADQVTEPTLILDLGTNGELLLATPDEMLCCSAAAGPAFEGGHVTWGMRGAPGAVERVTVDPADLAPTLAVIGDRPPLGICGSGLVSVVSALLGAGALEPVGSWEPDLETPWLREGPSGLEYLLAPASDTGTGKDLVLTRGDISELQLAKAALAAGATLLMQELGVERIEKVLLAGAFGNYLDPADACALGLFPGVGPERVEGVGNAAGAGALMALASRTQRRRAARIAEKMRYLELAAHPDFQSTFVKTLFFPR